jgi:hypothetical protein
MLRSSGSIAFLNRGSSTGAAHQASDLARPHAIEERHSAAAEERWNATRASAVEDPEAIEDALEGSEAPEGPEPLVVAAVERSRECPHPVATAVVSSSKKADFTAAV